MAEKLESGEDTKTFIFLDETFFLNIGTTAKLNYLVYNDRGDGTEPINLEFSVSVDGKHIVYNQSDGIKIISEDKIDTINDKKNELRKEQEKLFNTQKERALEKVKLESEEIEAQLKKSDAAKAKPEPAKSGESGK